MKSIIYQLRKQEERLRVLVQKREDKVDAMSERWQESQKCEDWEDKTQKIEAEAEELFNVIEELKDLS